MLNLIYGKCGIDYDGIPEGKALDCRRVSVSKPLFDEIVEEIENRYPDLTTTQILLFLLNYGPSVDENQEQPVVLKPNYIVPKSP